MFEGIGIMKLDESIKNILSFLLRLGISAGILFYLFHKMDIAAMAALLKEADVHFIILAAITLGITNLILFLRWLILMQGLDLKLPFIAVINYYFIGMFFNYFLPTSTGGDIIKTFGICQLTNEKAKVVASVVLDRLCGFMAIVIVAFFSFIFGYRILNDLSLLVAIFVLAFVSGSIMVILFNEKIYSFGCKIFDRVPKIKSSLMNMHYDIVLLKGKPSTIIWAVGVSCLSQGVLSLSWLLFAKALHQNIDLLYFLIFVPIICVASSLPSIGGLGTREYAAKTFFPKVGVSSEVAVSMSLLVYAFSLALSLIGGVIYVTQLSPRRIQHPPSPSGIGPEQN